MIEHTLEFSFKGERDYIQGPDIYNGIVAAINEGNFENLKLSFHGMLRHGVCKLHFAEQEEQLAKLNDIKAKGFYTLDGKQQYFAIHENLAEQRERVSQPYDEEVIRKQAAINGQAISYAAEAPYTFMEVIVSLTKLLHQSLYQDTGKWIFTQLELNQEVVDYSKLEIELKHNFRNRLTKSEIRVDGQLTGFIYFSLVGL